MKRILSLLASLFIFFNSFAGDGIHLGTVVIDAGHGGDDPGAVSKDRRSQEKNFTLDIARKLKAQINEAYPDIKVVLTRDSDEFISLNTRAEIANKNEANLFISIHINASTNRSARGFSVHVLGDSRYKNRDLFAQNMDIVKRENSVILLEEDYSTKYQGFDPEDPRSYIFMTLMQSANREQSLLFAQCVHDHLTDGPFETDRGIWQDPFYVLWKTSMPAVLIELGFISNSEDLNLLKTEGIREKLARCLFDSFTDYKNIYDSSMYIGNGTTNTAATSADASATVAPAAAATAATAVTAEVATTIAANAVPAEAPAPTAMGTVSATDAAAAPETKESPAVPAQKDSVQSSGVDDRNLFPSNKKKVEEAPKQAETSAPAPVAAENVAEEAKQPTKPSVLYGTQIFAVKKTISAGDPLFLGYKPTVIGSSLKKYVIGVSSDKEKAKEFNKSIKKKYPDSFMVKIENGNLRLL